MKSNTLFHNHFIFCSIEVRSNNLQCYECHPGKLHVDHNSHNHSHEMTMNCLTDDNDFGELKTCHPFDGACAKGTLSKTLW